MKKGLLGLVYLLAFILSVSGLLYASYDDDMKDANTAYANKDYTNALSLYKQADTENPNPKLEAFIAKLESFIASNNNTDPAVANKTTDQATPTPVSTEQPIPTPDTTVQAVTSIGSTTDQAVTTTGSTTDQAAAAKPVEQPPTDNQQVKKEASDDTFPRVILFALDAILAVAAVVLLVPSSH
jgi:hypothetical protein